MPVCQGFGPLNGVDSAFLLWQPSCQVSAGPGTIQIADTLTTQGCRLGGGAAHVVDGAQQR